jgi:tRNA G37 N-methylase Trm5
LFVGYYTLPLLVHAKALHIHACEWNENSVVALVENLRRNKVAERCTVHAGDNALTAPTLRDIADRVCLGLLPSSTRGWPLAVLLARPDGPVLLHIHENVADEEIERWMEATRLRFETLFKEINKPKTVSCRSLERVKSYAPRITHVVLDLLCV